MIVVVVMLAKMVVVMVAAMIREILRNVPHCSIYSSGRNCKEHFVLHISIQTVLSLSDSVTVVYHFKATSGQTL